MRWPIPESNLVFGLSVRRTSFTLATLQFKRLNFRGHGKRNDIVAMDFTIHAWQLTTSTSATIPIHSPQPICQACFEAGEERRRVAEGRLQGSASNPGGHPPIKTKGNWRSKSNFQFPIPWIPGGSAPIKNKGKWWAKIFKKNKTDRTSAEIWREVSRDWERTAENGRSL